MRALDFRENGPDRFPRHCRVLVVGGGLAGLELAAELGRGGGRDVLVLEAGPGHDLRHANWALDPDSALRLWLEPETDAYFSRPWSSAVPPHYTGGSGIRRRLGGRSLYWYGVCLPIEDSALTDPWPDAVVRDLRESWEGGPSLYTRVLRRLGAWRTPGAPGRGLVDDTSVHRLGGLELRVTPMAVRRSEADPRRWRAYSALESWTSPRAGRPPRGTRFRTGAEVVRVVVRGGAASGVVVRDAGTGDETEIGADRIVLAAGTLENTRLAGQALTEAGALAEPRLPGLSDHMVQGVFLRLAPRSASGLLERPGPGSYFAHRHPAARSNLFLELRPLPGGELLVDFQMTGEQLPSASNYVELEPTERGPWRSTVHAAPTAGDLLVLKAQRDILREVWEEIARITGLDRCALDFGDFSAPDRTNAFVLPETMRTAPYGVPMTWSGFLGTEDHEGGTLPLGSTLTDDHEFAALPGLFAAGPSTFPRLGAANPSLTTLALAHRLAARLTRG